MNDIGWIILSFILTALIILFIILWVICLWNENENKCDTFGTFGVEFNVDTTALNNCGTTRDQTCTFRFSSLDQCVKQCNILSCSAFTFNPNTNIMKIVNPTNTYNSHNTNLFVRQSGSIS